MRGDSRTGEGIKCQGTPYVVEYRLTSGPILQAGNEVTLLLWGKKLYLDLRLQINLDLACESNCLSSHTRLVSASLTSVASSLGRG